MGCTTRVALQERLEVAAAGIKATTTAMRESEQVHGAGRDQRGGSRGGKMQGPGQWSRKHWINGRASEDRDEWTEEVRARRDDKTQMSEVQLPEKSWRQFGRSPGQTGFSVHEQK